MRFEVTILGNGSASPTVGRHQSAHVLNVREQFFLIDCGEGTQERLMRAGISPLKIRAIFISHTHGDHLWGLVPLVSSMAFMGRRAPLPVFGPAALGRLLDFFFGSGVNSTDTGFAGPINFPVEFTAVSAAGTDAHPPVLYENASMEVLAVPLRHRVPTVGYVFREKQDAAGTRPRSYAYLSDTTASARAAEIVRATTSARAGVEGAAARGVDLMYHEATYLDADKRLAVRTGHSTALGAARVAARAGAGRLIIGHFSARYKDLAPLEAEARTVFPETYIAEELRTFSVAATSRRERGLTQKRARLRDEGSHKG